MENDQDEVPTAPIWMWIVLILIACVSFWCQATVTEERFVPALNVIATKFNIPDDIAGATLMAAGASSPELFSSIVALFITHSSLGLGTIVGSEIFNQLIICAGAVFASKTGTLELDRAILTREVGFYALSILLLYIALMDSEPDPSDPSGENHIFISFWEACMVFGGYIAYVLVCANMDAIVACCCSGGSNEQQALLSDDDDDKASYGATDASLRKSLRLPDLPFLRDASLESEPSGNFKQVSFYTTRSGDKHPELHHQPSSTDPAVAIKRAEDEGDEGARASFANARSSMLVKSLRTISGVDAAKRDGTSIRALDFLVHNEKPSDEKGLYDMEINAYEERLSCFMWQRSYFYNKAKFATHGWYLRWFSLDAHKMHSVPDRTNYEKYKVSYSRFNQIEVDEKRRIIKVVHQPDGGSRDFYLMAPSNSVLSAVVQKMEEMIHANEDNKATNGLEAKDDDDDDDAPDGDFLDGDAHEELTEFPVDGSTLEILLFCCLFPLRWIMHWTLPDVRHLDHHGEPVADDGGGNLLNKAWAAIVMCLVWLVIGSYAMVASLEALAALMDIPDAVVGVTVSAAGTSLPNYVASKVAAEKGFGNMAVSNAFGSNTFNIMIGLGLPWVLYTGFCGGTYHGLRDEGITESVIILGTVLLIFVVLIIPSKFVLYRWHGVLFIVLYIMYLAFCIGQVYIPALQKI